MFLQVVDHISALEANSSLLLRGRSMSYGQLVTDTTSVFDFKLIKVLGRGRFVSSDLLDAFLCPLIFFHSFGKVFLVRPVNAYAHEVYAMKVLIKKEVVKRHQVEHTKAERWILQNIQVRFICVKKCSMEQVLINFLNAASLCAQPKAFIPNCTQIIHGHRLLSGWRAIFSSEKIATVVCLLSRPYRCSHRFTSYCIDSQRVWCDFIPDRSH
jgi:hypothetical protein